MSDLFKERSMKYRVVYQEVRVHMLELDYDGDDVETLAESINVPFGPDDVVHFSIDCFELENV